MATRRPRPARHPRASVITIRTLIDDRLVEVHVAGGPPLIRLAEEWAYVLRSRARWVDDDSVREAFRERALADLERLGVPRAFVRQLATTTHVEVELHAWNTGDARADRAHEAAAEFPWEYLLSVASRGLGRYHPLLITRLFRNDSPAVVPPPPKRVLFVESAPGRLDDAYDFASERERIRAAVGADRVNAGQDEYGAADGASRHMHVSRTEDINRLKATVRGTPWDVLHVTGIDTHQAAWLIDGFYDEIEKTPALWKRVEAADGETVRDGMVLRDAHIKELPLAYEDLATILINPKRPPALVTLNLYYSGARTARELVRQGAQAALGFLDEIDDELAERFFQAFYGAWCRPGSTCAIPHAFIEAWQKMEGNHLHGTAIVMWMGRSVFEKFQWQPRASAAEQARVEDRETMLARLQKTPVGKLLQVELDVPAEVNYSLLHNDRPLLSKLTLTKLVREPLEDISVQVELNLGSQNYPFRCTHLVLDEPQLALAPSVCIPLTAVLPRSLRERVQSTVYVRVTCCGGRTAWESTERVTLIPVDEWVDDTTNNPWLPSFVLPRDPAILRIIASSRRYLVGLRDDPAAGFDGYQSIDEQAETPAAGVDAQVQAIWTALVNEFRLQYINPPPAYSDRSQRLRTPGDILGSNSGTCIDLALLLASCLEYIDIYPVLVLLEGHAFAGYWRSDAAHEAFAHVTHVPLEVPSAGSRPARAAAVRFVDGFGWRLTRLHYDEIMRYVTGGDLVLLEATYLTSASSFAEAVKEGRANMRSRREFDSLLDIRLARSARPPVTPLPVIQD